MDIGSLLKTKQSNFLMMMYLFCDYLTMMYLPMNQTTNHWFEQYAWEVLQHSPHVVPPTKYFAARLINFPHTLEMDYCVKGSDVLNYQWDKCLNRAHEYVKTLCACPTYVRINKLCPQYYVQYCSGNFLP